MSYYLCQEQKHCVDCDIITYSKQPRSLSALSMLTFKEQGHGRDVLIFRVLIKSWQLFATSATTVNITANRKEKKGRHRGHFGLMVEGFFLFVGFQANSTVIYYQIKTFM